MHTSAIPKWEEFVGVLYAESAIRSARCLLSDGTRGTKACRPQSVDNDMPCRFNAAVHGVPSPDLSWKCSCTHGQHSHTVWECKCQVDCDGHGGLFELCLTHKSCFQCRLQLYLVW